jgi:hypothetical protein
MHWRVMGEANPIRFLVTESPLASHVWCLYLDSCLTLFKKNLYVKSLDCAGLFARHRIIWIWNRPAVPYTGASFLSLSFWPLVHCPWWSFGQICCAAAFGTCTCPASCSWIHGENETAEGSVLPQNSHPYICPKNSANSLHTFEVQFSKSASQICEVCH